MKSMKSSTACPCSRERKVASAAAYSCSGVPPAFGAGFAGVTLGGAATVGAGAGATLGRSTAAAGGDAGAGDVTAASGGIGAGTGDAAGRPDGGVPPG